MTSLPPCVLYTQDADVIERVQGLLKSIARVCHVNSAHRMDAQLRQLGPTLLLVDLQSENAWLMLAQVQKLHPKTVMIALGTPGSDPMPEAEAAGFFATEDLQMDEQRFQRLVQRGLDHLRLTIENQLLREESAKLEAQLMTTPQRSERESTPLPLRHLYRAFRHFDKVEVLLESLVEGVASATMVYRVGIVSWVQTSRTYRLRSGLRCLEDTQSLEYSETDPLIRWLEIHAHLISRSTLEHIKNPSERMFLKQTLDAFGAEVLIPLQSHRRLLGWLFIGNRVTGVPFDHYDLEDLMIVAEHISTALENAFLYEETTIQKTLLGTLLHTMPTGIVSIDHEGTVQCINPSAQKLLDISSKEMLNQAVGRLGNRMADVLLRTLKGEDLSQSQKWTHPFTKCILSVRAHGLMDKNVRVGAMAMIEDMTAEQTMREKHEHLERTAFWTELAASMSHQIRNPLVAIRTFAQLLPEKYDDPEFRNEFWKLVPKEVDRLNELIDLINNFAHPPELVFRPLDIKKTIQNGIEFVRFLFPSKNIQIEISIEENLLPVKGDEHALTECLAHLLTNAVEATADQKNSHVVLTVKNVNSTTHSVAMTVQDNGQGIPLEIRNKVFSPFCTTKSLGMGLGLPIVQRTVLDHNGRLHIDTSEKGTSVTIMLPVSQFNGA